jgi:hypothetical protein
MCIKNGISVFVAVLLFPVNHQNCDCTVGAFISIDHLLLNSISLYFILMEFFLLYFIINQW